MNSSISNDTPNYNLIAPLSMTCAFLAVLIASMILFFVSISKQLHTVTHLLICNTSLSSILYCLVQCNNYIYLLFLTWDTSDLSCRWRGYFSYMSIVAVVYSYLLQAISRLFLAVLSTKYRWLTSFSTHFTLIVIKWLIVFILPLPALLTNDLSFQPASLCWIPKRFLLHIGYTILVYYFIPICIIVIIYITIYYRIRRSTTNAFTQQSLPKRTSNRDLEVLRNILILFGIYILGGVPSVFYMLSGVKIFYTIGVISVSLAVAIEKFFSILLDREIRKICLKYFCQSTTRVLPMTFNTATTIK